MPYSYYEHVSDIGIRAEGSTLEEAFACGVEAALGVMFDLDTIDDVTAVEANATAPEVDLLFVEAINEVLSLMARDELAGKGIRDVKIERDGGGEGGGGGRGGRVLLYLRSLRREGRHGKAHRRNGGQGGHLLGPRLQPKRRVARAYLHPRRMKALRGGQWTWKWK